MKKFQPGYADDSGSFPGGDSAFPGAMSIGLFGPGGAGNDSFPGADLAAGKGGGGGGTKPVGTIAQLADYLVNGFWQFNGEIAHHWASSTITYDISALTPAEQFLATSAMEAWHEVANVTFVQAAPGTANITFNHDGNMTAFESDSFSGSGAMTSATVDISADWFSTDGGANDGKSGIDSYVYQTYVHEIGHALGLGHQGPYNGSAVYSTNATYANDTWQYSVMSYFAQNNYSGSSYRYVVTPQMADIYAVDSIYGAATTRSGDTVYGFHDTAGPIYDFTAYSQAPALTIYDSGGNNTLDCSGYSANQTIDLHPGAFSSVGGLVHNIGISTTTIIQTAIAGSGNDTLIANDLGCTLIAGSGNDTLLGGAGNDTLIAGTGLDTLTGGAGVNIFVFATGDSLPAQQDRITDFVSGVDRIDLSGIDAISGTPAHDNFHFIGTSAFHHVAGELDYSYNSSLNITLLQGDTNGDGVADFTIDLTGNVTIAAADLIGIQPSGTTIEALGSTSLVQVGNNYYLDSISSGTGPVLKYNGAPVFATQFNPWTLIGAEQTATGYEVAWKIPGTQQFSIWNTDSNGNVTSYSNLSGTSAALESLETSFHQDLNGDGVIGATIESLGSTSLVQVGNNYYMDSMSSGTGPALKYNGAPVFATQFSPWTPVGAEQTATGYEVAWQIPGTQQFSIWITDSSGNVMSYSNLSGTSTALESLETSFHQDLNGDGVIGIPTTPIPIESFGSTSLMQVGNSYYLDSISSGTGPQLKNAGAAVSVGQFNPWTPIGAEQTATGYEVAWQIPGTQQFSIWNTDSNGNVTSYSNLSGTSTALESLETSFHQDLNGDGVIGVPSGQAVMKSNPAASVLVASNDTFVFRPDFGTDVISHPGSAETINQDGFSSVASNAQLAAFLNEAQSGQSQALFQSTNGGHDTVFGLGNHDNITLANLDPTGLHASSFIIH